MFAVIAVLQLGVKSVLKILVTAKVCPLLDPENDLVKVAFPEASATTPATV